MAMIKGIPVVLLQKIKVDEDPFGQAIYREREIIVENVLVSPSSANDIITSQNLTGKKAVYTLAIPKGDQNSWEDNNVVFLGRKWHVLGFAIEGIDENRKNGVEISELDNIVYDKLVEDRLIRENARNFSGFLDNQEQDEALDMTGQNRGLGR